MKKIIISMLLLLSKVPFIQSKIQNFIKKEMDNAVKDGIEEKINQKFDVDVCYSLNDFQLIDSKSEKDVKMSFLFSFSDDDIKRILYHYLKIDVNAQIKNLEFIKADNNSFKIELFASVHNEELKKLISKKI